MKIPCTNCNQHLEIPEELAGQTIECPACNASELSSNPAFQLDDLDHSCKCNSCKATSKVKDWKYGCNLQWHLCRLYEVHAKCKTKKPPSSMPKTRPKRQVGPLTTEQLHELDIKRMRKCKLEPLPPAPNIPSVKLRERFAHLFK